MIKGITPKLAEAGKIKIGGLGPERKSQAGNKYRLPEKYDYFVVTSTTRNESGDLEIDHEVMNKLGLDSDFKPRSIPIILHSDKIDEVFPTSYALYSGRKCACRGDGETAIKREIKNSGKGVKATKQYTGQEKKIKCPCEYLNASKEPKCKPNGKLYCSIDAPGATVAGAVHIWRTTSIISIEQMIGSLIQIQSICGTLKNIPLRLVVKPISVEPPGQGAITVYCCHVELRSSDIASIQHGALRARELRNQLGQPESGYKEILSLPGANESEQEQAEIAAEFYCEEEEQKEEETTAEEKIEPKELADDLI